MNRRFAWTVLVAIAALVVTIVALTPARSAVQRLFSGSGSEPPARQTAGAPAGVPMTAPAPDAADSPARGEVALDVRRQQLIGVRTAPAVSGPMRSEIRVVGTVRYDETRQAEVNTRVDGWIRELFADFTGKAVRKGEALFTLYSPELVATQDEYLLALRAFARAEGSEATPTRGVGARLVQAARDRLVRWGMSDADIQELTQRGKASDAITVGSPVNGVIVEKAAIRGMRVTAGQALFRVADLSTVWVEASVHEQDIASVRVGQSATITLDAYPAESFAGRATYIDTAVDEATRTLKVRFQAANGRGRLRPGMYADLEIRGQAVTALTVPSDAVLDSGLQQVVFVAQGDGYFVPRPVKVGRRLADTVEIVDGLTEGEQVATAATFFLDSESQLRAGLQNYHASGARGSEASSTRSPFDIALRAQPDPPRAGENQFEVMVKDPAGRPVIDAEVLLQWFMPAMPAMSMPAMKNTVVLKHVKDGRYAGAGQVLTAGNWDVTVSATRGGREIASKTFAVAAK